MKLSAVMNDNCLFFFWIVLPQASLRPVIGLGTGRRRVYGSGLLLQYCWFSGINVSIGVGEQIMLGFHQGQIVCIQMRERVGLSQIRQTEISELGLLQCSHSL